MRVSHVIRALAAPMAVLASSPGLRQPRSARGDRPGSQGSRRGAAEAAARAHARRSAEREQPTHDNAVYGRAAATRRLTEPVGKRKRQKYIVEGVEEAEAVSSPSDEGSSDGGSECCVMSRCGYPLGTQLGAQWVAVATHNAAKRDVDGQETRVRIRLSESYEDRPRLVLRPQWRGAYESGASRSPETSRFCCVMSRCGYPLGTQLGAQWVATHNAAVADHQPLRPSLSCSRGTLCSPSGRTPWRGRQPTPPCGRRGASLPPRSTDARASRRYDGTAATRLRAGRDGGAGSQTLRCAQSAMAGLS